MSYGELALPEDQIAERNLEVIRLTAEGKTRHYIQSQTGCNAKLQREINDEYKSFIRQDLWTSNRSREIIGYMDEHYTAIIQRMYEAVDQADMADDYKTKAQVLKAVAEIEGKRVDALQKAGVFAAQNIGDEVAASEAKQAAIIDILKEVALEFPDAGKKIAQKIAELNGTVISTRVISGEIDD